jgi:hypothetical protein
MRVSDFQNKTREELLQMADECFVEMETLYPQELRAGKLLQAQFYINEIAYRENQTARKEDARISRRDFWLEVLVIVLILGELIVSVAAIRLGIRDAGKQAEILGHMDASTALTAAAAKEQATQLAQLTEQQRKSLEALGHMNNELQGSLRKTSEMAEATGKQLKILQDEQANRLAEQEKKPKLALFVGDTPLNSTASVPLIPKEQTPTKTVFNLRLQNDGDAAATQGLLRIIVFGKDVSLDCSSQFQHMYEPDSNSPQHVILVPFERLRPHGIILMSLTANYPAGQATFPIYINVDANEIPVATTLGAFNVTPPKP